MTDCPNPDCQERDQLAATTMANLMRERDALKARVEELEAKAKSARYTRSDWERAHELLDAAGVLATPEGVVGVHLIDRINAVLKVWTAIGEHSAQVCHDLKFLCNSNPEVNRAITAHREAFRPQA